MDKSKFRVVMLGFGLALMTFMFSCKGSSASTSSSGVNAGSQQANVEQGSTEGNEQLKSTESQNSGAGVQNPLGVSTQDKMNKQKAPAKKTPTGGN